MLEAFPQLAPAVYGDRTSIYEDLVSRWHVNLELQGENGASHIERLHAGR
jgi:hypothetical protein